MREDALWRFGDPAEDGELVWGESDRADALPERLVEAEPRFSQERRQTALEKRLGIAGERGVHGCAVSVAFDGGIRHPL